MNGTRVLLPSARQDQLVELGLATIADGRIRYVAPGYADNLADPEEQVRADVYLDLVTHLGYDDVASIEMEKRHKVGHPHKKSDAKIDVLVNAVDNDERKPFMLIELKSPEDYEKYLETSLKTQLFNVAAIENQRFGSLRYLVYATRWWENGELRQKVVCIDYSKHRSFEGWEQAGRPNLRVIPQDYGIARVPQYVKGGDPDLSTTVTRDELQRIRRDLHNILWGGGKYQNELFFNLVGLFLAKIYDEKETEDGSAYEFQIFHEDDEPEPAKRVYERMNARYRAALKDYLHYSRAELSKVKDIVFDAQKVRYVVEVLQGISFTTSTFDVIGDFFEGIVRGEFKQSKGQYLTHTNLIKFIVEGLQLGSLTIDLINKHKRMPYIIDPACGSSAFLIEAMGTATSQVLGNPQALRKSDAVRDFVRHSFPEYRRNAWAKDFIYGLEVNGDLAVASKVNMVGHGDGSANIEARDSLLPFKDFESGLLQVTKKDASYRKPVNEQFDVVVSNPPFSVTVDRDTAKLFPATYLQGASIAEKLAKSGDQEVATELLFIERYYQLLRAGGRLAVVLPESVFDAGSTRWSRLFLFRFFWVRAIVSLPTEAFAPYTTTKTCILFAEKKTPEDVAAWDRLASSKAEEYDELWRQFDVFVKEPELSKRSIEIAERLRADVPGAFPDELVEQAGAAVLAAIEDADPDRNRDVDEVIDALKRTLAGGDRTLEDRVAAIAQRKRSLPGAAQAYRERLSGRDRLVELLRKLLGDLFDKEHAELSPDELVREYAEELKYADSSWWTFREVSAELATDGLLLGDVDETGYKRGIRGEENRPNELFADVDGKIVINDPPRTMLDQLRKHVRWTDAPD